MKNKTEHRKFQLSGRKVGGRLVILGLILCLCLAFALLTLLQAKDSAGFEFRNYIHEMGWEPVTLGPGETLEQRFEAGGSSSGVLKAIHLDGLWDEGKPVDLEVRILREGECLTSHRLVLDGKDALSGEELWEGAHDLVGWKLDQPITLARRNTYTIEVTNLDSEASLKLGVNPGIQSGSLTVAGEPVPGFLNILVERGLIYLPAFRTVAVLAAITVLTVMIGAALVLFSEIRVQVLYLLLAVAFGFVMLFDLTPLYGFDIRFQFDSTYVVSNQMMGLGGAQELPSLKNPDVNSVFYERRVGDDYSQYQFYSDTNVSYNYEDNRSGLLRWKATPEEQEMILAEAWQGQIGEQLYLFIPQALGFTIARLLGLGMYPMLMLARMISYGLLVLAVYKAISRVPFGKYLLMIFGLLPAVMVQCLSISRDAMIFIMAFYLIGKVLQAAYSDKDPTIWDWVGILGVSVLLAPCKMIYLPLSFLWLLIIYRKNILEKKQRWYRVALRILAISLPILIFFVATNLASIGSLAQAERASLTSEPSRTLTAILQDPSHAAFIFLNTIRMELGDYFINALQLYDIGLGSSHTVTLVFTGLMCLAACAAGSDPREVRPLERFFFVLVFAGVFLLTALASMQWTPMSSYVIQGLQGRYLTPALPLLFLAAAHNRVAVVKEDWCRKAVGLGCCILPAIALMNMFLWTKVH